MNTGTLAAKLRDTARLVRLAAIGRWLGLSVAMLLAAAIAAVAGDAALSLPSWGLVTVDCVLAAMVTVALSLF